MGCRLGVAFGDESSLYSFAEGHPMHHSRSELFAQSLAELARKSPKLVSIVKPSAAKEEDLLLFHTREYVNFVKDSSKIGEGYLDDGDTPSFKGVYEASVFPVGSTLFGLSKILEGKFDHFFNPIGGLHHARRDRAGGFCVFDDAAIAISNALKDDLMKRVAYVDIDAHHGDGVYYGFESDPRAVIADIHEDGRFLYPGTGRASEMGIGGATGTKLNLPLMPNSRDEEFSQAFDQVEDFLKSFSPEFIFFQCGADGLNGDPITHLQYTAKAHAYATKKLHKLAHDICQGRILAMGGGGYNPENVRSAWMSVAEELFSGKY
jgi:acetoin utilization protein AcuC